ncbi:unnamed protein product, partial [Protopolystoma xenopodis]
MFDGAFELPENFEPTAPPHKPDEPSTEKRFDFLSSPNDNRSRASHSLISPSLSQLVRSPAASKIYSNPQTELLCAMLELTNPNAIHLGKQSYSLDELSAQLARRNEEAEDDNEDEDEAYIEGKEEWGDQGDVPETAVGDLPLVTEDIHGKHKYLDDEIDLSSEYDPLVCHISPQKISCARRLVLPDPKFAPTTPIPSVRNPEEVDLGSPNNDSCESNESPADTEFPEKTCEEYVPQSLWSSSPSSPKRQLPLYTAKPTLTQDYAPTSSAEQASI